MPGTIAMSSASITEGVCVRVCQVCLVHVPVPFGSQTRALEGSQLLILMLMLSVLDQPSREQPPFGLRLRKRQREILHDLLALFPKTMSSNFDVPSLVQAILLCITVASQ